mmetsp:Transcript_47854/g.86566  ORF Transcript_47854/g.86566 Transcript_47854/m.86566 type:complete len:265 (-) Transcript_47854:81-875(-)
MGPRTPILASRMRERSADEGFRALLRSPRLMTARCIAGGASRRSAAARTSTSFALMNSSISAPLGPGAPPPMLGTGRLIAPPLASRIRASSVADAFSGPLGGADERISLLIVGELERRALAACSSMLLVLMYSSSSLVLGRPMPERQPPPPRASTRASLMRTINAAEEFRALLRSPRSSTFRCTSAGQSRRSCAARSSTSLALMKASSSSLRGGSVSVIVASYTEHTERTTRHGRLDGQMAHKTAAIVRTIVPRQQSCAEARSP